MKRILVANRGEIAVRIIRTCKALGLETVAVYSQADRESLHVRLADRALCIGPARPAESYLNVAALVTAASAAGCDAIHPGYGFLAENAAFAQACIEHGVGFVGPAPEAIRLMGNKIEARRIVAEIGVPVVPGSPGVLHTAQEAAALAGGVGYPLLLKAAAGGGGRGMRVVRAAAELMPAFQEAQGEARAAFGDETLFAERFLERVRHVEIQLLGGRDGTVIHLGERDCSLQRRSQKLLEEAPAVALSAACRERLAECALAIARRIGYSSLGTIEFVYDPVTDEAFFLEMNTRVQVEHPVTEMVTGLDLIAEQLHVAEHGSPRLRQEAIASRGHAIECRINAESPATFRPAPGRIVAWSPPEGEGVRVDTHAYQGYVVPPFYDSLIAKLIVWAEDRRAAIHRMRLALDGFGVEGIETTIPFHRALLDHPSFLRNQTHTRWVEAELLQASQVA
ncbi:MAG: acetyl-CoA carboxylase biotin carboxylase subunit [bacterium]|nr:acetyl-CoA carboxylase biotin carboxylase subunit [bacterium]